MVIRRKRLFKVAEHSFSARSCWCDSARAQGLQKQTCRWYSDHFICSMSALSLLFFFVIVLMALVLYIKGMLEKVTTQRTQQFSDFPNRQNPVKCSACAVARKIETDCFGTSSWFLTIQSLEFQEIWQNNSSGPTWMIYREKSEFWHREFLIIQKTI